MKVSIITPTYNSEVFIKDCLESIKNQTYKKIEHIIFDNMSIDRTKDISNEYNNIFIQKPDNSMYEALNAGILKSSGEIICFLNSDDLYPENVTIEKIVSYFKMNKDINIVYGKCMRVDEKLRYIYTHTPNKKLTYEYAIKRIFVISHPVVFIKKSIFEKYGLYDLNLKYMADCEYWLRLLHENVEFRYIDDTLAIFRIHSSNLSITSNTANDICYISKKYGYKNSPTKARFYLLYDNRYNFNYLDFLIKKYILRRIQNLQKR